MRYRGDGSYKPEDYTMEESLADLINNEAQCVDRLNTSIRAYDKAKKTGLKTFEYVKDIEEAKLDIADSRNKIKNYFINKLGLERQDKTCQR